MKNFLLVISVVFLTSGCALTMKDVPLIAPKPVEETGPGAQISLGMTRQQVMAALNKLVTVGFEVDPSSGVTKAIQINSLYSSEMLTLGAVTYQVDYYIVDSEKAQIIIADSDLFPVVFQDDILAAKGQEGLVQLKGKHQTQ